MLPVECRLGSATVSSARGPDFRSALCVIQLDDWRIGQPSVWLSDPHCRVVAHEQVQLAKNVIRKFYLFIPISTFTYLSFFLQIRRHYSCCYCWPYVTPNQPTSFNIKMSSFFLLFFRLLFFWFVC